MDTAFSWTSVRSPKGGGERVRYRILGLPGRAEELLRLEDAAEHGAKRDSVPSRDLSHGEAAHEMIYQDLPVERGHAAQGRSDSRPAFGAFESFIEDIRCGQL